MSFAGCEGRREYADGECMVMAGCLLRLLQQHLLPCHNWSCVRMVLARHSAARLPS